MAGLQYAGEYQVKELLIHTSSGSILSLTKATQSIDIYEDMFKTALSGSITILDVDKYEPLLNTISPSSNDTITFFSNKFPSV